MFSMKKHIFALLICFVIATVGKAQQAPTADAVLKEARAKAAKENKKVMVIFHASWCGWCRKMDTSLNDPSVKNFFDKNLIVVPTDDPMDKDASKQTVYFNFRQNYYISGIKDNILSINPWLKQTIGWNDYNGAPGTFDYKQ